MKDMKKIITILIILTGILSLNLQAEAQTFNSSYYTPYMYQYQVGPYTFTELGTGYGSGSDEPKVDTEDVDDIEGITRQQKSTPKGSLRMSVPTSFGLLHMNDLIPKFIEEYPEVQVSVNLASLFCQG